MSQNEVNSNLVERFKAAVQGLHYMSESDYPFTVSLWHNESVEHLMPDRLLDLLGKSEDEPVELVTVETFFAPLVKEREWHGDEERAIGDRFKAVLALLTETLTEVNIYRIGKIEIDIYIVGKTPQDGWIMISTKAIET